MRRAALNKSKAKLKDRPRDDLPAAPTATATVAVAASSVTAVEALLRDEGFQAHNHELLDPSVPVPNQAPVPPAPVSASASVTGHDAAPDLLSQLDHDRQLLVHSAADSSHAAVSSPTLDASMTDAFPAELDAVSATAAATAATNTTSSAIATSAPPTNFTPSTAAHLPHQDGDGDNDHVTTTISNTYANTSQSVESDHDDDIELDLDASFLPPTLDDLYIPTSNPNLDPDYVHHYHAEDYDLDMSDSDGGASLDDDGIYVPQLQAEHHSHPAQPQEDDDAQAPSSGPVNYLLHTFFNVPSLAGADIVMDAAPPPGPWAPTPNNAPPSTTTTSYANRTPRSCPDQQPQSNNAGVRKPRLDRLPLALVARGTHRALIFDASLCTLSRGHPPAGADTHERGSVRRSPRRPI
ncbi:hypothetical protein NW754_012515 [Fusarium falciforme]|nr:hypothetical protein NW754_012515 [Fusarium falciforme]